MVVETVEVILPPSSRLGSIGSTKPKKKVHYFFDYAIFIGESKELHCVSP